jgi:arylsulfatase A-like enzyme
VTARTARPAPAGAACACLLAWLVAAGCGPSGEPAPAGGTASGSGHAREPVPPPHHVLLVSIDTLRADHVGSYGYAKPTTPHLDALAAEAIVFENASTTAPWTLPAHASLLTGLYPSHHGAREERDSLSPDVTTLAGALRSRGFATASVVNVVFASAYFGLDRDFDTHVLVGNNERPRGTAREVTRRGLEWLDAQGERQTFLFLHYFDAHSDYTAVSRFREPFPSQPGRLRGRTRELYALNAGAIRAEPRDVDHLVSLYDAGVRQLDHDLGALFDALRERGRLADTLLVVTADHGEEFGEHGNFSHGRHYQELLRVPLIVRLPGGASGGARIAEPVSLVDVAPTVLAAVGADSDAATDGVDLAPLWRGASAAGAGRRIFAQTGPFMGDAFRSVREGEFKLILDRRTGRRELYHLADDPGEGTDVAAEHPEVADRLAGAIAELEATALGATPAVDLDADAAARLRELGYLGAPPPAAE